MGQNHRSAFTLAQCQCLFFGWDYLGGFLKTNGGTQQPWVFLLKMIMLGCEMGVAPFKEAPILFTVVYDMFYMYCILFLYCISLGEMVGVTRHHSIILKFKQSNV